MKKYLALYMAPTAALDTMMQGMTPELSKQHMDSWKVWMDSHKGVIVDPGASLGKNKRVSSTGVADVRNEVTGYSIVEADSHEAAAAVFTDNPMLQMAEAYIEVVEVVPMRAS